MTREELVLEEIASFKEKVFDEVSKRVIGQKDVIEMILVSILSEGHALLHGVPGLGKTLIVKSLAETMDLKFNRIQFTPDLMPSDIIGTDVVEERDGKKVFVFYKGPVFANLILADEINRTPPKTQSALLEAMQEKSITVYGKTYHLERPFIVLATENPIEQEGTYALPESQIDRFMMSIYVDYPILDEEVIIATEKSWFEKATLSKVVSKEKLLDYQKFVEKIPISNEIIRYIVKIVRETRPEISKLDLVKRSVAFGAGVRASQMMVIAAKAQAALNGKPAVSEEEIIKVAIPVLRHRIVLNYSAIAEGVKPEQIVKEVIEEVEI